MTVCNKSFTQGLRGEKIKIDKAYVDKHLGDIAKDKDLSKFIL